MIRTLTAAERIVARFLVAKEPPKTIKFGPFEIIVSAAHVQYIPQLEEGFSKAEKMYHAAGFPLKGIIKVYVRLRGWSSRSFFDPNENFIGIIPHNLTRPDAFHTFVHELAHWYHFNIVSGGFHNKAIVEKFNEVRGEQQTGGSNYEILRDQIKVKEKELAQAKRALRKGMVIKVEDWNDPFRHDYKYVREYKVLKPADRQGHETLCELLNPSPWDQDVNKHTAHPGEYVRKVLTQTLAANTPEGAKITALEKIVRDLWDEANDYAMGKKHETRYEELRSEWIPTDYARTNAIEWFAEIMTTAVVSPSSLSPAVWAWLKAVV